MLSGGELVFSAEVRYLVRNMVRSHPMDGVNIAEAKAHLSELVERAEAGDTVEIKPRTTVGELPARPRGKTAVTDAQQYARQPRRILLAAQAVHRFADQRPAGR
jgi:antitoxin (DNA-binding transcriptional repressor) of toxin-antitoxin stability system